MVRLDKLLDAWRADPRVDATIELGNMLLRASTRAKDALPRTFVVEFGDEASRRHGSKVAVLEVLSRLFAAAGEGARAQALYARAAALAPGEARVSQLEAALREAGLAVPPPEVAARLAPPPAPDPPARSELPPPRGPASSLAEFAPAGGARPFPIDSALLDEDPRQAPPHVPDVPTRELETRGIASALEEQTIPRRQRAPTVAGLGVPMPPATTGPAPAASPPTTGAAAGAPARSSQPPAPGAPPTAAATSSSSARPPPQRRSKTLVPDAGAAPPPAFPAMPPVAGMPAFPAPTGRGPDAASAARMFTPVRAFTPPPGNMSWPGVGPLPPGASPGARMEQPLLPADDASDGDTATDIYSPDRRRQAIIDNPTTTQESLTRPQMLAPAARPEASGSSPPTQTRVVPEEAQLRAAAASLAARTRAGDAGAGPVPSPRPAARRAVPTRERRRVPDPEDDPATGVTAIDTSARTSPAGAGAAPFVAAPRRVDDRREPDEGGPATARRDTSELLAAALRPPTAGAAPALGSPSASATAPHPPVAPPPVRAPLASSPDGSPTRAVAPAVKPTLVSRSGPSAPAVKPTLLSPGVRGAPPLAPPPAEEPSHTDDIDTKVRPLAPPAPPHVTGAHAAAPHFPAAHADDDGPSTNVMAGGAGGARAAAAPGEASRIVDEPSIEELSADALQTVDEPALPAREAAVDPPRLDQRPVRSTQRLAGTVAPAVVWSPPAARAPHEDPAFREVRTKVLTAEESAEAGRIDPLPIAAAGEEWMITPPPPMVPRFGPPPASVRPLPSFGPPPVASLAPTFGPPSSVPVGGPAAGGVQPAAGRRGVASPILVGAIVGVALSLLVAGGAWLYDELSQTPKTSAEGVAAGPDLDALVLVGRRAELDRVDALLRDPAPAGAEKARAMTRLRERALRALELGSTEGLADAGRAARAAGWSDGEVAFAELARAVSERDASAAAKITEAWADARSTDALFALAAAAAAEQRGDAKAAERYGEALGLEPRLRPAALRVARAELLDGDEERGGARVDALEAAGGGPEVVALRGLAWLRARRTSGSPGKGPDVPADRDLLPVELRFVPDAMRLAAGDVPAARRKTAVDEGVSRADVPAVAVLFGELAYELRIEATSLAIGRAQLRAHPEYAPALVLFARSALALAKLGELEAAAAGLPTPQQTLLRTVAAYERGDVAAVLEARAWLGDRDEVGREGIVARAERLAGKKRMPEERIRALRRPGIVGGELVAVDALLDAGDLAAARAIVEAWGDPSSHPLLALRAARLLRYEGKLGDAEAALDVAVPTRPALVERVLLEAETPARRAHARSMLDARFGDDRAFYEVYLLALDDEAAKAEELLETLELPGDDAPLARRLAAALAVAAVGDERRRDGIRRLAAAWPEHPDVIRAMRLASRAGKASAPAPAPRRKAAPPKPRRR